MKLQFSDYNTVYIENFVSELLIRTVCSGIEKAFVRYNLRCSSWKGQIVEGLPYEDSDSVG